METQILLTMYHWLEGVKPGSRPVSVFAAARHLRLDLLSVGFAARYRPSFGWGFRRTRRLGRGSCSYFRASRSGRHFRLGDRYSVSCPGVSCNSGPCLTSPDISGRPTFWAAALPRGSYLTQQSDRDNRSSHARKNISLLESPRYDCFSQESTKR